jgi:acetyl esterase
MKPTSTAIHSSGRFSGRLPLVHGVAMLLLATLCPAQDSRPDLFSRLDTNKDGKVLVEELPDRQKANFKRIDADSDGAISRDELVKFTGNTRRPESAPQARAAIEPTHADVAYGPHERNKIDLYLVESKAPTPLVLYIHGGGFQGGDKRPAGSVRDYHAAGWSVAAINYRLTNVLPAPGQYLDCARAIQFIRHNAGKWNINP